MKIKSIIAAAIVAVTSVGSFANTTLNTQELGIITAPTSFASIANSLAGSFLDTYTFSLPGASNVGTSLTNVSFFGFGGITSFAAMLDSNPLTLATLTVGPATAQVLAGGALLVSGSHTLTVSGTGSLIGASYGGSIVATPIPEPETFAMLLAGLGLMGAIALRRNKANAG